MDLLAMYATSQPDKAAVIDDRPGQAVVTYTYAELDRRANQLAHHLVDLGVDEATKVVWCGQNSASVVVGTNAIRKVGVVGVPLNYRLGGMSRLRHRQLRRQGRLRRRRICPAHLAGPRPGPQTDRRARLRRRRSAGTPT